MQQRPVPAEDIVWAVSEAEDFDGWRRDVRDWIQSHASDRTRTKSSRSYLKCLARANRISGRTAGGLQEARERYSTAVRCRDGWFGGC